MAFFNSSGHYSLQLTFLAISLILSRLCVMAQIIPKPNSALSSNNELAQAGPRPYLSVAYGLYGKLKP